MGVFDAMVGIASIWVPLARPASFDTASAHAAPRLTEHVIAAARQWDLTIGDIL